MYSKHMSTRISDEMNDRLSLMAGVKSKGTLVREILEDVTSQFVAIAKARNCSEEELAELFSSIQIVPKTANVYSINLAVEDAGVK